MLPKLQLFGVSSLVFCHIAFYSSIIFAQCSGDSGRGSLITLTTDGDGGGGDGGGSDSGGGASDTGTDGIPGIDPIDGGGGHCSDECSSGSCNPDMSRSANPGDPVLLPYRSFVQVETDFSMKERGARFVIQRTHIANEFVDPFYMADYRSRGRYRFCLGPGIDPNRLDFYLLAGDPNRPRMSPFGLAWNSTLEMYAYYRNHGCGHSEYDPCEVIEHINLGGYYHHTLFGWARGEARDGQFGTIGNVDWFRFDAYPGYSYPTIDGHDEARRYRNPGVLTNRNGDRYFFDYSLPLDANEPNSNAANEDNAIQLLRRRENRFGVGYDYVYATRGTCGYGNVRYRLDHVRTPSGRNLVFRYDPNYYGYTDPNEHDPNTEYMEPVTSIDLADEGGTVISEGLVRYEYYGPSHPNSPRQLRRVEKGCNCTGGGKHVREYVYGQAAFNPNIAGTESWFPAYPLVQIKDGNGNTVLHNHYDPNYPDRNMGDGRPWYVRSQEAPHPNDASQTVTWKYEEKLQYHENYLPWLNLPEIVSNVVQPDDTNTVYETSVGYRAYLPLYLGVCLPQGLTRVEKQAGGRTLMWDEYKYNRWRGVTGITRPDSATETYVYDGRGRKTQTLVQDSASGKWYQTEKLEYTGFDDFSQLSRRYEPNDPNIYWSYTYDAQGNQTAVTGPQVTKGLAEGLQSYQPVDTYTYLTSSDANHPNFPGNWGMTDTHTDPNGMVTKFEYNQYGYMTRKIDDYGGQNLVHTYDPDPLGRTLQYTDPNGAVTTYEYEGLLGKIKRVQTAQGQVTEYRYDPNTGFLNQEIVFTNTAAYDPNSADPNDPNAARVTTYVRHPSLGKVFSVTQTGVGTTTYGYDAMGRVTYMKNARGLETQRIYDGFGRVTELQEREPGASNFVKVAGYTYDAMSRVTEQTRYDDPNNPTVGRTIKFAYDAMGRKTSREGPDGTTTHMVYDPAGRVTRQYVTATPSPTSTCLSDTTFEYDELGQVWRQRDRKTPGVDDNSNDRIVRTYRFRDGKTQRVENGSVGTDNIVTYAYDSAGRVIQTTLPGGTVIEPNYYANGQVNIQKITYADGTVRKAEYVRNATGQVEQMRVYYDPNLPRDANLPAYETTSFTYYSTGQVKTRTDARGIVTHQEYDAQGHLVRSYENYQGPLQREIRYEYDPNNGNLSKYIGMNGTQEQTTVYSYDYRGNVKTTTYPGGDTVSMTYDRGGQILTREVLGGATVGYEYDDSGRLSKQVGVVPKQGGSDTYDDTFHYNGLGRMVTATRKLNGTERSKVEFTYDGLGRLSTEKLTIDGASKTIEYPLYDQADRRLRMTLPEGEQFNYSYTDAGQVDQILRGTTALADYDYLGPAVHRRRVYSALDPNIHVDWVAGRDGLLRLRESANSRTDPGDPNYDVLWASYQYARQATGLPTRETFSLFYDPNGTPRQFEHDELGRLERVIYGSDPNHSPQERFIMDLAGNRTKYYGRHGEEPNYTLDPNGANQYTLIEPGVSEPNYDGAGNLLQDHRGYTYAYDHDNKLIRVSKGETTLVSYEYDSLGRRVKSIGLPSAGVVRYYLSSGYNEEAEYDGAGQRLRYYVHGPTYIDERVVMHNDPVAGGAATTGSDCTYLLKDLYTVAGMADERGWPVERYDYDAYGKVYMERVRVLPWAADFDGDGDVDDDDLAVVHAAYRGSGQEPNGPRGWRADLDGDGDVDGSDYAVFADAYRGSGVAPGGNLSLRSASMAVSRIGNPYFFTGRRLDVIDIQDAGTPDHFTDDYAGLQLYDYRRRSYDPTVGRFGQRDPIQVEECLYAYVTSSPLRYADPSGLILYDIPVKESKCNDLAVMLTFGSWLNKWNHALWRQWLFGNGKAWNGIDWEAFDPDGRIVSNELDKSVNRQLSSANLLKCGESKRLTDTAREMTDDTARSSIAMVSHFRLWYECIGQASKVCSAKGCCKYIIMELSCNYHARDFVQFWEENERNPRDARFTELGITITDRLVRRCFPLGQGFDLSSDTSKDFFGIFPCGSP